MDPLLFPVFAQAALTFTLMLWTGLVRYKAISDGRTRIKDVALGNTAWPDDVRKIGNCYNNQHEMPVLFYAVIILILITETTSAAYVALAWAYVGLRLVHAAIFTTTNKIEHRFFAFAASNGVLIALWAIFALNVARA